MSVHVAKRIFPSREGEAERFFALRYVDGGTVPFAHRAAVERLLLRAGGRAPWPPRRIEPAPADPEGPPARPAPDVESRAAALAICQRLSEPPGTLSLFQRVVTG